MAKWFARFLFWACFWFATLGASTSCGTTVKYVTRHEVPEASLAYPKKHAAAERAATVALWVACGDDRPTYASGSGVIVSPTEVLTAQHVITCNKAIGPLGAIGDLRWVRAVKEDGTSVVMDLESYGRNGADAASLRARKGYEFEGAPVVTQGLAFTDDIVCMSNAIPTRRRRCAPVDLELRRRLWTGLLVDFGNSGSGVWNVRGELVGLVTNVIPCGVGGACGGVVDTRIRWFDLQDYDKSTQAQISYSANLLLMRWY